MAHAQLCAAATAFLALALAASATAAAAPAPAIKTATAAVPSISAVRACAPFSILIQPATQDADNTTGTVVISGEPNVLDAALVQYASGLLTISAQHGFESRLPITAVITLGTNDTLLLVENVGTADVVLAPGIVAASLTLSSNGISNIYVYGVSAAHLFVFNTGMGTTWVGGNATDVSVTAGGTSHTYLVGLTVQGNVQASLTDIAQLWVAGGTVTGTAMGLSKVLYGSGTCNVQSQIFSLIPGPSIFEPCQPTNPALAPTFKPTWTCGITVATQGAACLLGFTGAAATPMTLPLVPTATPEVTVPPVLSPPPATTAPNSSGGARRPNPTAPASGPTTTVTPSGSVTTYTSTTPGGYSYSSGSVSGTGLPSQSQTSTSVDGAPSVGTTAAERQGLPNGVPLGLPQTASSGLSSSSLGCTMAPQPMLPSS